MKRYFSAFIGLVLALALFPAAGLAEAPVNRVVRIGDKAPDFSLSTIDGKNITLGNCTGVKATVITFWSIFCFPCRDELPEMSEFYEANKAAGLSVVGINLDGPSYENMVKPFIEEKKVTIPIAYDVETESFYQTAERYGVVGTPTTFILDDNGKVRFMHLGRMSSSLLKPIIDSMKTSDYCADLIKPEKPKLIETEQATQSEPK